METLTIFKLDIQSDEPRFEDFKDQLKAYLANKYDADFSSDELCGATIGYVFHDDEIKEMAELIFGQSEEVFTDIIREVRFKGNGFCSKCGGSTLANEGDKHYWFRKEPEPGEYKCLYCDSTVTIK
jgi:ribosomal protein S27AE